MGRKPDENRLSKKDTRTCVVKLVSTLQESGYHGDVRLKLRAGELVHVELQQSALPRDILQDRFLCALVDHDAKNGEVQEARP
jgi:hypothetical protein